MRIGSLVRGIIAADRTRRSGWRGMHVTGDVVMAAAQALRERAPAAVSADRGQETGAAISRDHPRHLLPSGSRPRLSRRFLSKADH
jgi:hypothetical protein